MLILKKLKMSGASGIEQGFWPSMESQNFRLQIYRDWVSSKKHGTEMSDFVKRKEISDEDFTSILKEFRSLDPTGEQWGQS